MMENLIQSNWYSIGNQLRNSRLTRDRGYLNAGNEGKPSVVRAFQDSLFFRAERKDSDASAKGYLAYDSSKHGRMGSASDMPRRKAEGVRERADNNLFVSKNKNEVRDYAQKAQGGERELLNIIASRDEVNAMKFDVDSWGYKTTERLTRIVRDRMTESAKANLNTLLAVKEDDDVELNKVLRNVLE